MAGAPRIGGTVQRPLQYVDLKNIVMKRLQGMKRKQYFGQAPREALERRARDLFKDRNLDLGDTE